jgi:predicted transcriptional regulator
MTSKKNTRVEEQAEAIIKDEITSEKLHPVLVQLLEKSIKEADEGKTFTHEEVMRMTKERFPFLK